MKPDQRIEARKLLRTHGSLTLEGAAPLVMCTTDIASTGLSISISRQLKAGQGCLVNFDLFLNGKKHSVAVVAKVNYSVCGGIDGFKAVLQFIEIDPAGAKAIAQFMNC
jgi:hypothetical protein